MKSDFDFTGLSKNSDCCHDGDSSINIDGDLDAILSHAGNRHPLQPISELGSSAVNIRDDASEPKEALAAAALEGFLAGRESMTGETGDQFSPAWTHMKGAAASVGAHEALEFDSAYDAIHNSRGAIGAADDERFRPLKSPHLDEDDIERMRRHQSEVKAYLAIYGHLNGFPS